VERVQALDPAAVERGRVPAPAQAVLESPTADDPVDLEASVDPVALEVPEASDAPEDQEILDAPDDLVTLVDPAAPATETGLVAETCLAGATTTIGITDRGMAIGPARHWPGDSARGAYGRSARGLTTRGTTPMRIRTMSKLPSSSTVPR
jgi:hypothetical protein